MTVDATLLLIAPEFEALDSSIREGMATLAAQSVGTVFGASQELATAYLTAHMLTVRGRSGITGAVKSMKEGDLSLTYAEGGNTGRYGSTSYGIEFMRLQKENVFSAITRSM